MNELGAPEVAAELGLGPTYLRWLGELERTDPLGDELAHVGPTEAVGLLERLGCPQPVVAEAAATLPDRRRDPARHWLVQRCAAQLIETIGDPGAARRVPPRLPVELGAAGSCLPIHVFLAVMPETLAWQRAHGIPEEVTWATLSDLGRHTALQLETTGRPGIDEPWWMTLHLRCIIFELGRLQYVTYDQRVGPEQPEPWIDDQEAARLGEGFRPGDPALSVHIPGGEPLTPQACEDSYRRARAFFDEHFPSPTRRIAVCSSWLLDEGLDALLPASSNILAFRQGFTLVEGGRPADRDVLWFAFRRREMDLEALEERTSLQRSLAAHLRGGGHVLSRTGWRELPEVG